MVLPLSETGLNCVCFHTETEEGAHARVVWLTSVQIWILSPKAALGTPDGENRLGQGRENVKEFFKLNPAIADEIETKIRATMLVVPVKPGSTPDDDATDDTDN